MLENTPDNRKQALSLLRAGRLDPARAAYEALLAAAPDDADLVGLLAAVALQQGRPREAEALFGRCLGLAAEPRKVPRIEHYRRDLAPDEEIVADIGGCFDYPVIVRTTRTHQSSDSLLREERKTAVLVSGPAALRDHLERYDWGEFYAVEFVDLKRRDGFYRQQRAVVVDGEIIVSRSSIFREWMVTSWRSKPEGIEFYRANPHTIEECNRIVADPEAPLGGAAMRTLEAIRDRIPLDMFGVDFEVDRDGGVVFFEAGASMVLQPMNLPGEPPDVRLPMEPLVWIDDAFRELVARRIAESPRGPA